MDYSEYKNEAIIKECVKKIFTKDDLLNFVEETNKRQQLVFKRKNEQPIDGQKPENGFLNAYFETLKKEGNFLEMPEKEFMFLEELKKELLKIPLLKLQIAFQPTDKFLEKISQWLENTSGQKIILDISVNPKITGGAIMEYRGKYLNLSLEKKINELTLSHVLV